MDRVLLDGATVISTPLLRNIGHTQDGHTSPIGRQQVRASTEYKLSGKMELIISQESALVPTRWVAA
jgi:hypothetical protein